MVKVIVAKEKIDCEHLLGKFVDSSYYDVLIEEDTDCYMEPNCGIDISADCSPPDECLTCTKHNALDERRIAFKFRKNYFTKEQQQQAYLGLREAAVQSQNRGLAAGPRGDSLGGREWVTDYEMAILDFFTRDDSVLFEDNSVAKIRAEFAKRDGTENTRGQVWLVSKVTKMFGEYNGWFDRWVDSIHNQPREVQKASAEEVISCISFTTYAQQVYSGISGWFDRYPRIPYARATSYTENNYDKFKLSFPFLQQLNTGFKELLPNRWAAQKAAVDTIDERFVVPGTVFSTITVNKTFRTACHRDAGDFSDGLSNLLVLSNNGNYKGGYLVFPEYRIAVNVRPGDLLLVNNHEVIHGNTPIELLDDEAERISLVCYLREGLLNSGEYEYEQARREFVDTRRKNKEHRLWKPLWNGISPNCFSDNDDAKQDWEAAREWYDFLNSKGEDGRRWLNKYHPWLVDKFENVGLEAFF